MTQLRWCSCMKPLHGCSPSQMHFYLHLSETNNPPDPALMHCMLIGPQVQLWLAGTKPGAISKLSSEARYRCTVCRSACIDHKVNVVYIWGLLSFQLCQLEDNELEQAIYTLHELSVVCDYIINIAVGWKLHISKYKMKAGVYLAKCGFLWW